MLIVLQKEMFSAPNFSLNVNFLSDKVNGLFLKNINEVFILLNYFLGLAAY